MQEFCSVTASSYDADALAPLLTEKSGEGWQVISIVSAGTNVVAYLGREVSAADEIGGPAFVDTIDTVEDGVIVADEIHVADEIQVDGEETTDDVVPDDVVAAAAAVPVDEPAGWGVEPEATTEPAESVEDLAAQISEPVADVAAVETVAEPVVAEPVVVEPVVVEPAQQAPPVESAVPAGWYADPSGRYELRYWDGTAWTEHVSRAGQQFTDPPVA